MSSTGSLSRHIPFRWRLRACTLIARKEARRGTCISACAMRLPRYGVIKVEGFGGTKECVYKEGRKGSGRTKDHCSRFDILLMKSNTMEPKYISL